MNGPATCQVAIVGGGFSGLLAGARLREVGVERIRIIEAGADVGGTWYWNRYPGAQCDIESYIYLPLLEELGYIPTEKYVYGPEIHEHARRIADRFGLGHEPQGDEGNREKDGEAEAVDQADDEADNLPRAAPEQIAQQAEL